MRPVARLVSSVVFSILAVPAFAGFQSTVEYLVAVGRVTGQGGAQFYTTIWATNLSGSPVSFKLDFLKQGQANPSPASFSDTLAAGQTKMYENVVETKLGLSNAIGAARLTATGKILVSERIFNQAPGADIGNTQGLFFAGVPASFSISGGQSASIQGINQGGSENFRYNFAMIETGGGSPTANVQVFDGNGTLLGQKAYKLLAYEQIQPNIADVVAGVSTINARITATVTGTGSLILAGAQLANVSQDSSGFEMSFRDEILGSGGGTAGVTSLNGLTGAVTLAAGSNVTLTPSGSTITIAASGGGGGGGLTLPFSGSGDGPVSAFSVNNTDTGLSSTGIDGAGETGISGKGSRIGVLGVGGQAFGYSLFPGTGVVGAGEAIGVYAWSSHGDGISAGSGDGLGISASSASGTTAVFGEGSSSSASSYAVYGHALGNGAGVFGHAAHGSGVVGQSDSGTYGVFAYGGFGGTGPKYFVEPHPSEPTKEIRYVCLEGRESGTYFRGTGKIVNGFASVEVPEDFRMVTSEKGLSVQLTPVGDFASMVVKSYGLDRIVVQANRDVEFFYMINGIRKAFEDHQPISENRDFIPGSADDARLVASLPAESVRRLKANGTLNEDGSVNLETAHRLGWDQQESWKRAETERERAAAIPR